MGSRDHDSFELSSTIDLADLLQLAKKASLLLLCVPLRRSKVVVNTWY